MYKGDINDILNIISKIKVNNIWIDEPDLEEIFLHYYNKEV
jgi:ABC-2 type transport system ATP-binding protein